MGRVERARDGGSSQNSAPLLPPSPSECRATHLAAWDVCPGEYSARSMSEPLLSGVPGRDVAAAPSDTVFSGSRKLRCVDIITARWQPLA